MSEKFNAPKVEKSYIGVSKNPDGSLDYSKAASFIPSKESIARRDAEHKARYISGSGYKYAYDLRKIQMQNHDASMNKSEKESLRKIYELKAKKLDDKLQIYNAFLGNREESISAKAMADKLNEFKEILMTILESPVDQNGNFSNKSVEYIGRYHSSHVTNTNEIYKKIIHLIEPFTPSNINKLLKNVTDVERDLLKESEQQ